MTKQIASTDPAGRCAVAPGSRRHGRRAPVVGCGQWTNPAVQALDAALVLLERPAAAEPERHQPVPEPDLDAQPNARQPQRLDFNRAARHHIYRHPKRNRPVIELAAAPPPVKPPPARPGMSRDVQSGACHGGSHKGGGEGSPQSADGGEP